MPQKRVGLVLVLLVSCLACDRSIKSPPKELLGLWTTDAPAYQNRYLKFEKDYVLFGGGQDKVPAIQQVLKIDVRPDSKQTIYTLHSVDADGAHELIFVYDPSGDGTLRIKNQRDVVWKKRPIHEAGSWPLVIQSVTGARVRVAASQSTGTFISPRPARK